MEEFNTKYFIQLIEKHPHIYDKSSKHFKNYMMKRKSFRTIATILNVPEDTCIQKWRNLRDRFGRERRKESTWPYLKSLHFLEKHVKFRNTYSLANIPSTSTDLEMSSIYTQDQSIAGIEEEDIVLKEEPLYPLDSSSDIITPQSRPSSRSSNIDNSGDCKQLLKVTENMTDKLMALASPAKSSNQLFGEFIGQRLDEMPRERSKTLRLKLLTLLEEED